MQIDRVRHGNYIVLLEVNERIAGYNKQIPELFKLECENQKHLRARLQKGSTAFGAIVGTVMSPPGIGLGAGLAMGASFVPFIPVTLPVVVISGIAGGIFTAISMGGITRHRIRQEGKKKFENHIKATIAIPFLEEMLDMVEGDMQSESDRKKNRCLKSAAKRIESEIKHHKRRLRV